MRRLCIMMFLGCSPFIYGQQSVNTSGGDFSSAQGTMSFSVGQVATNYIENSAARNEGVQQPYEFFSVLTIEELQVQYHFQSFPNPTQGIVYLRATEPFHGAIQILDETGRIVLEQPWSDGTDVVLDLTAFAQGIYSIKILENKAYQLIKIVKN